jgi:hypothetical protein
MGAARRFVLAVGLVATGAAVLNPPWRETLTDRMGVHEFWSFAPAWEGPKLDYRPPDSFYKFRLDLGRLLGELGVIVSACSLALLALRPRRPTSPPPGLDPPRVDAAPVIWVSPEAEHYITTRW